MVGKNLFLKQGGMRRSSERNIQHGKGQDGRGSRFLMSLVFCLAFLIGGEAYGQGPVLHWTFDEGSGDALDTGSGEPANGVLLPDAERTDNTPGGYSKHALDLTAPGLESWVNGGDADKVDTLAQFTMTTWLYLEGLNSEQGGSGNVRLLAKQSAGNFDGFSWNLNNPLDGDRATDNFRLGMFLGGDEAFAFGQSTESMGADGQWTFAAVTYDPEGDEDNMLFYFGDESLGVEQLGDPLTVYAGQLNSTTGIATVNVGFTDAAPGNDFSADGFQDDVRIYDRVLDLAELEEVRLANLAAAGLLGDFNDDGVLNALDIDALTTEVIAGTNDVSYDVNDDQRVDQLDRGVWVSDLKNTYVGDANLDGVFDSTDFVSVFVAGLYETGQAAGWSEGDWDGDQRFDSGDFVAAFVDGGYELGPKGAMAVPEPSSFWLLLGLAVVLQGVVMRRMRRRSAQLVRVSKDRR